MTGLIRASQYQEYTAALQDSIAIPGVVDFALGADGYPCVRMRHPMGGQVELDQPAGEELLYRRRDAARVPRRPGAGRRRLEDGPDPRRPGPGGIGLAWPQWGDAADWPPLERGGVPFDGFLRLLPWTPVHADAQHGDEVCSDDMADDPALCALPHRFEALYTIGLRPGDAGALDAADERRRADALVQREYGFTEAQRARYARPAAAQEEGAEPIEPPAELERRRRERTARRTNDHAWSSERVTEPFPPREELWLSLTVRNTGDRRLRFTTGFRASFATEGDGERARFVKVVGLRGKHSLRRDGRDGGPPRVRQDDDDELLDRAYVECGAREFIALCPGWPAHVAVANLEGLRDVAVEHRALPGDAGRHAGLSPARIAVPVSLEPGETWTGTASIVAHSQYWELLPWEAAAGANLASVVPPPRATILQDPDYYWNMMP
ncbi:hypothetical protein QBZ16_004062 [Prototheca wickerhamii]|uniref:Uncharacterized protein n=1 Tax=Prototheca wickerhamii TaxID=3111 RepID=A0AAD9MH91_PROWI|nr:hypothetical protein QBZ16_004062 [Prototheca wickerhamii]